MEDHPASHSGNNSNGASPQMPSATELEQTLQRLVRRVAMMLQAERCAFLLYDHDSGDLVARSPALGLSPDQIRQLRLSSQRGIGGRAYNSGAPVIIETPEQLQALDEEDGAPL